MTPSMSDPSARSQAIRKTVEESRDDLLELLDALVGCRTTLGHEEPAQAIVEDWLRTCGFAVERVVPDTEAALADPYAGYPYLS